MAELNVAVIGAGVAGLGAAVAMGRKGHNVTLYERSLFKREVGAAITLTPNASRILDVWGFDAAAAGATPKQIYRHMDLKTTTISPDGQVDLSQVATRFGAGFNAFHRVHLHDALRALAAGNGAKFELGRGAVDLDAIAGTITFDDGATVQKDLVIVADGIRTTFLKEITEQDIPLKRIGKSVFRSLIPMEKLQADESIWPPLWQGCPSGFLIGVEGGVLFVTYPCADNKIMNCAIFHETPPYLADYADWNSPATHEDVYDALKNLHPRLSTVAKHADEWRSFPIAFRDLVPTMVRGRSVLIGDAAHPFQPTHAQGACMALEDGAALGELFASWGSEESVAKRLQLFDRLRLPRANTTQVYSNSMFYKNKSNDNALSEVIRAYYDGPLLSETAKAWDESIQNYFYSYDVVRESAKALKYKNSPETLPQSALRYFGRYEEGEDGEEAK